jgi:2,4-dienoyl-CoA reductase (NADPH2)
MADFAPFRFPLPENLLTKAGSLGISLPFDTDTTILFTSVRVGLRTIPNRLAVQPMEGYDGEDDGSPSEWTIRRYHRYATGGCGLIWFEATSVREEGRSNPHQLWIHAGNWRRFAALVRQLRQTASRVLGRSHRPYMVLQLTHSGRYSKPKGIPAPVRTCIHPLFDPSPENLKAISDRELEKLADDFIAATRLAWQAGFDAIDLKACHGYLGHELLFSRTRKRSPYGGNSCERRTNWLLSLCDAIREEVPAIDICSRINVFDGLRDCWGIIPDNPLMPDLKEPLLLASALASNDCRILNITAGIPRINPWIGRPFSKPVPGQEIPPEHPLQGIHRLIELTSSVQKEVPSVPVLGTGYSWFRHLFPFVASGVIRQGKASLIGLGRMSFAYPDAAMDLQKNGKLDPKKCCLACSACSFLMGHGQMTGCVVRDKSPYSRIYKSIGK